MCTRVSRYEMVAEKVQGYNSDIIDKRMNSAENIAGFIIESLKSDSMIVEHFMVFMLDTKLKVIGFSDISRGGLDTALVHPREVYQPAMLTAKCAGIIVAHNHPSGDPTPSHEDIMTTDRLSDAGKILGITLIDHVIIGDGTWTSLKADGYIS